MKKMYLKLLVLIVIPFGLSAQTKGLLISEVFTNPSGSDSPFEYVELVATANINFATTPYAVVFTDNGTATSNGWKAGGSVSYGFTITSGSVTAGQVVYVGGTSMAPLSNGGISIKSKNTGSSSGDSFGSSNAAGVLGQGGSNADGVAVFNVAAASITSSTVPVDAIFFGSAIGSAFKTSGSGYQLPVNDNYAGGKLLTSSFLAPDPASDQIIKATGVFNPSTDSFTTNRTWSITSTASYNTSAVTLAGGGGNVAPTLSFNTTASKLVDLASGKISCVMNNATDPFIVTGLDINVGDEDLSTVTFSMTSSKTSVVPNANFTVIGTGSARKFKITPTGVGYATITLKVIDAQGLNKSISLSLAVSASLATAATKDIYNTGVADGSTAIPIDANYMFVADDETNVIKLYDRNNSGLSLYQFDVNPYLNLGGTEVDMEASFRSPTNPNRIYWIGSLSNSKSGEARPDRNRIFATDIVGTGANATLTFVGYYSNLRSKLITWGDANGYNFTAKAATGIEPKRIDGFNIEGLEMGPDGTTMYIGFRAPYVGTGTNKALICPLLNFESWFGNGSPSANPTFGSPIELNLNNHGIRSLGKNTSNEYLIVAGSYAATGTFELYAWNGQAASAPVLLNVDLTNLKPEGIVDVPASLSGAFSVDLISDLGSNILYNDGLENKDVVEPNHRKFLTSTLNVNSTFLRRSSVAQENVLKTNEIYSYPNPVSTTLNIASDTIPLSNTACFIYNNLGQLVKKVILNTAESNTTVDFSDLKSGLYFVSLLEMSKTFRIIKE